ncbi:MAG: enoyl-CoA hydratase [Actinobacteria bacterium]|nr:enoyl-CoA hydratase [Actinomycetota bacterium]MSY38353.1 enoyl-CoA hydratase [Actinomycetota bacterium]MSZ40927.1 enoyl-CoA hydratase [Actinomycetota bacterium]
MANVSVHQTIHGRVLVISIDRPEKRNAINAEVTAGIDAALNELEDNPALWVGVLTGTPTMFSAGTDISSRDAGRTERGGEYGLIRRNRRKPLIAAVEGNALGGGFEVALACDLIVASTTARFGLPEVQRGVIATSGALFRTMRALPINVARQMLIAGLILDAERGYELGLVAEVTPPEHACAAAVAMAERICLASPFSIQQTLIAINSQLAQEDETGWEATQVAIDAILQSEDMKEGHSAFFEKRTPQWKGR